MNTGRTGPGAGNPPITQAIRVLRKDRSRLVLTLCCMAMTSLLHAQENEANGAMRQPGTFGTSMTMGKETPQDATTGRSGASDSEAKANDPIPEQLHRSTPMPTPSQTVEKTKDPDAEAEDEPAPSPSNETSMKEKREEQAALGSRGDSGSGGNAAQNAPAAQRIEWLGQVYVLCRHRDFLNTLSDEYVPEGESAEDWTQLLAVQKTSGKHPSQLASTLGRHAGISVEVLREDAETCVAKIQNAENGMAHQEGVILIQRAGGKEEALAVITFLLKPSRLDANAAAMRLSAWRERFLARLRRDTNAGASAEIDAANSTGSGGQ